MTPQDLAALVPMVYPQRFPRTAELTAVELMEVHVGSYRKNQSLVGDCVLLLTELRYWKRLLKMIDASARLHGIPYCDQGPFQLPRIPTTMGGCCYLCSRTSFYFVGSLCQRLVDDGAIAIGKTNTPEGGLGSHTYNELGQTCNP
jgi:amidase